MTKITAELKYLSGFGNLFSSEAREGALPLGRNSPQLAPFGLYTELISGTAFTAPRADNHRTWMYRLRPAAMHARAEQISISTWLSGPFTGVPTPANRLRWNPWAGVNGGTDFVDGIFTVAGNGDPHSQTGLAVHVYHATCSMQNKFLVNSDAEMLIVPQDGSLLIQTELGGLLVSPGEIALLPRGLRWRIELPAGPARGYICENYGSPFRLPELGPIGSNGLANARDFLAPVAAFEQSVGNYRVINKFLGCFWASQQSH